MPHRPIVIHRHEVFKYINALAAYKARHDLMTPDQTTRDGYSNSGFTVAVDGTFVSVCYLSSVPANATENSEAEAKLGRKADRVTFSEAFVPKAGQLQPILQ
jgi:hypothetical protein